MCRVIAAVYAPARKIDDNVSPVDFALPATKSHTVPPDDPPRRTLWLSTQHDDVVTIALKGARKDCPDLPRPARNHDPHGDLPSPMKRFRYSRCGTRHWS